MFSFENLTMSFHSRSRLTAECEEKKVFTETRNNKFLKILTLTRHVRLHKEILNEAMKCNSSIWSHELQLPAVMNTSQSIDSSHLHLFILESESEFQITKFSTVIKI